MGIAISAMSKEEDESKEPSGLTCDDYGAVEVERPLVFGCCNKCGVFCKRLHWFCISCFINALFSPILLCFHALRLYCCPCVFSYIEKCIGHTFRAICCECCWRFTDSEFPPNSDTIGKTEKSFVPGIRDDACCCPSLVETGGDVWWRRAEELFEKEHEAQLFSGGITPSDIAQGSLGDCWLLAAIATLAEHEGVIESCFISTNYSPLGRYKIALWNPVKNERETFSIDDTIPCNKDGKPLFTTPNGNELWVFLLEKAFAITTHILCCLELKVYGATQNLLPPACSSWSPHLKCKFKAPLAKQDGQDGCTIDPQAFVAPPPHAGGRGQTGETQGRGAWL